MAEVKPKTDEMSELGLPSIESAEPDKKPEIYEHEIFSEPHKAAVKEKWDAGSYTNEDVELYVAGTNLRLQDGIIWNMDKDDVWTLHKGGYLPDGMAQEYLAFKEHAQLPSSWSGDYILRNIADGRTMEDTMKDMGGIHFTMADPSQLVVDALTGGSMIGMRMAGRKATTTAVKSGAGKKVIQWTKDLLKGALTKEGAKEAAVQTGFGIVSSAGMIATEGAGGGTGTQLMAGLMTPLGASVLLNMTRQTFIQYFRRLSTGNATVAKELRNIILQSSDDGMKGLREVMDELDEAAVGMTKFSSYDEGLAMPDGKARASTASQDSPAMVHLKI